LVDDLRAGSDLTDREASDRARSMERDVLPEHEATAGHSFLWITRRDERIGRLWIGPMLGDPSLLYIWDFLVDRAHRGEGVGGAMLDEVIGLAREHDFHGVGLTVWDINPDARRLLRANGLRAGS
jgi:ribosomal protein S18 acetylase RimI-like enzyme